MGSLPTSPIKVTDLLINMLAKASRGDSSFAEVRLRDGMGSTRCMAPRLVFQSSLPLHRSLILFQ